MDVLCVGYACIDINFKARHHPGPDEKLRATSMHSCGGGPAANAAVTIARLGGKAGFAGYLGEDAFGESHLREFADEEGQHHMPAFDIEPVDTTGAGDAFHGAFALGLAQGLSVRDNMRRASATGALTCLKPGARSALPEKHRVDALVGA